MSNVTAAENRFLEQAAAISPAEIEALADVENADLPEEEQVGADYPPATTYDRAFKLDAADEPETANDYEPDDELAVGAHSPTYGNSEAEEYELRDPR